MLRDNPFQVVGLLASAAEKERQHQASRIRAFLEVGKPLSFEEEILFHGCRRNSITASRALKDLQDARLRLRGGVFWFTDSGLVDDKLLELIAAQDWVGSFELTRKVVEKQSLGKAYLSSVSNHATLALFVATSMKPGTFKPALSAGKWRSRKQAFLDGLRWKAQVMAEGQEEALVGLYSRVADDVLVKSRESVMMVFVEGVEEVVAEAVKLGVSVNWGEVMSVLREAGVTADTLEHRLISSIREEMDSLIQDVNRVNSKSANVKAIDELLQFQKAALHIVHRIADVSGVDGLQFQGESTRVADALFSKSVEHWSEFGEATWHVLYRDRKRLEGFKDLLCALLEMALSSPLKMRIQEGLNVVLNVLSQLDVLERGKKEERAKEKEAEARRKERERQQRKRREEARRQSRKEAEQARKEQQRKKQQAQDALRGARNKEAKKQGRLEAERMRLERNAPDGVPKWFIDWLIEFESMKWQSHLRRFDHLVRALPDGGGFSICDGLWDWARTRKKNDPDFNVSVAMRWCGNQYATRVVPLLESMWKMSVRFPSLEATTETVRLQLGKRMRTTPPPVIPVAGSLVDRLDALLEDEQEHVQEQEWKGHSDYSELTSGDIVAYVFAGLFLLWILSLIMS